MKYFFVLVLSLLQVVMFAQAPLDVYHSFPTTEPPQGWTFNLNINSGDLFYYGGSDENPSLRLDATGEYARVEIAESPGSISYYVRSTGFTPPVAPGTVFSVQESVNGISWNTLRVLDEDNLSGDFTFFSDVPNPMARYFRFFYTNKASGSNIALDEVSIVKAPAGLDARLMVYRDEQKVLSGHSVTFSSEENLVLDLENEGLEEALQISNVTITGPDAAAFSTLPAPGQIEPGQTDFLQVNVDGEPGEVYEAQFEISTNDEYNPLYIIHLIGHGGEFAAEPTSGPENMEVENITTYGFELNWTHADEIPDRYLVIQNTTGIPDVPEDGIDYDISEYIGSSRVVYNDSGTSFNPRNIAAGTTYYYFAFSVNGTGDYSNYLQSAPLAATVTTPEDMIGDYYNSLNSYDPDFVAELSDLIFPHTQLEYLDYPDYLINEFESRDTTEGRKVVTGYYAAFEYLYHDPFQWDVLSREHVFAHSWFTTNPAFDEMEYTDYHNLFPTHNDSANVLRLNHPFGEVETVHYQFLQGRIGWNSAGQYVYEPRDFAKGRVARAIFYMLTTYNNQIGGAWSLPENQDQELLKNWHFTYLPDGREIARNDYIHDIQHNRNPFIDSVYFACRIDFETMTYIDNPDDWCLSVDVSEVKAGVAVVFPNPGNGRFVLQFTRATTSETAIRIFDIGGRVVYQRTVQPGVMSTEVDLSELPPGIYPLTWQNQQQSQHIQVVIR